MLARDTIYLVILASWRQAYQSAPTPVNKAPPQAASHAITGCSREPSLAVAVSNRVLSGALLSLDSCCHCEHSMVGLVGEVMMAGMCSYSTSASARKATACVWGVVCGFYCVLWGAL